MNTTELKLWKEYTEEIKKSNNAYWKEYTQFVNKQIKDWKEEQKIYEEAVKPYKDTRNKILRKYERLEKEYDKLPFFIKLFKSPPDIFEYHIAMNNVYIPPRPSIPSLLSMPSLLKPTYEGFLDWRVKSL